MQHLIVNGHARTVVNGRMHSMHYMTLCPVIPVPSTFCPVIPPMYMMLGPQGTGSSSSGRAGAAAVTVQASRPQMVLEQQTMLSDMVTTTTGPWETVAWKALLDIILPLVCLSLLYQLIEWAADRARIAIKSRLQGGGDIALQLRSRSTITALVLLALRQPATFVLPPLTLAYVFRTGLHIVDLVVHKYEPKLPELAEYLLGRVSAELVPLDAGLQTLLNITGAIFTAWFLIQLKDILVQDLILVEAVRSGRKELERIYLPLSSLLSWAAMLACAVSVCASLGISLEPLLAVGGAGGIAAGFASQQVLTNIVSGINIFLTRPFVVGDQVKFTGGTDLEGTVEAVEIVRTILRTTGGTLVAIPNKTVAELIVFNRTRSLAAAAAPAADEPAAVAVAAAAAPLRRVLCFTIELGREMEDKLSEIKAQVREYLNNTTLQQLAGLGLAGNNNNNNISHDDEESRGSADQQTKSTAEATARAPDGSSDMEPPQQQQLDAELATAPVAAAVTSLMAAITGDDTKASDSLAATGVVQPDSSIEEQQQPDLGPLPVSITLSKLQKDSITLSVRCEVLVPAAAMLQDAVEEQTEQVLIGVSGMIKENFEGVVLWC